MFYTHVIITFTCHVMFNVIDLVIILAMAFVSKCSGGCMTSFDYCSLSLAPHTATLLSAVGITGPHPHLSKQCPPGTLAGMDIVRWETSVYMFNVCTCTFKS